jgi:hypothetical protein
VQETEPGQRVMPLMADEESQILKFIEKILVFLAKNRKIW